MDLSVAIASISSILGKIAELTSDYNEAFRIMAGLSGALTVMTEFIQKRINDGNPVDEQAFNHLIETLGAIERKIDDISACAQKRCGVIPYGKWYIWGAPLVGNCCGRIGSTKLIKQLTDLEGDLNGDIKFIELQMTANAVQSLHLLAADRVAAVFNSEDGKEVWSSSFGDAMIVPQEKLASAFNTVLRMDVNQQNDSELSITNKISHLAAADLARGGKVSASALSARLGTGSFRSWIRGAIGGIGRSVMLPGHTAKINCIACVEGSVITGSSDCTVKIYDSTGGVLVNRATMVGHNDSVTCVAASRDHSMAVSGSADGFIRTWCIHSGEHLGSYSVVTGVRDLFCQGENMVYSCVAPSLSITVRNMSTGAFVAKLSGHVGGTTALYPMADGRILSGGTNRSVRVWSGSSVDLEANQAHPSHIIRVISGPGFIATASKSALRFHSPDCIRESKKTSSIRGRIHDACLGDEFVLVLASNGCETCDDEPATDLYVVSPYGSEVSSARIPPGASAVSVGYSEGKAYVGLVSGGILVYGVTSPASSPTMVSRVSSSVPGTPPSIPSDPAVPCRVAHNNDSVAVCAPGSSELHVTEVVNGGETQIVDVRDEITALCGFKDGWAVGKNGSACFLSKSGSVMKKLKIPGKVLWLGASKVRPADLFVDSESGDSHEMFVVGENGAAETVWYVQPNSSRTCEPCLVLGDRFMVRPGYREGTLGVLDAVRMTPMGNLDFSATEADPVSSICASHNAFFTLHGGMDLLRWNNVTDGPVSRVRTYLNPVTSIVALRGEERFLVGMIDGSVMEEGENEGHPFLMNHSVGPVTVVDTAAGGYSVGVESRLMAVGI
nr:WD40 repeat-containing protein [Oceanusvirus sp.]